MRDVVLVGGRYSLSRLALIVAAARLDPGGAGPLYATPEPETFSLNLPDPKDTLKLLNFEMPEPEFIPNDKKRKWKPRPAHWGKR